MPPETIERLIEDNLEEDLEDMPEYTDWRTWIPHRTWWEDDKRPHKMEERELPKDVQKVVKDFQNNYRDDYKWDETKYRHQRDVHDEFTVTFKNGRTKQCVKWIEDIIIWLKKWLYWEVLKTLSSYSKMDYVWYDSEKQMFKFNYFDTMGSKKSQDIRWVKVLEELKKMLSTKTSVPYTKDDLAGDYVLKTVLTNDVSIKAKALLASERIWTCQKRWNCTYDWLAEGGVDFITNWCNVPFLIYNADNEIIWRSLCRLFYNKDLTKEFLYIDRLYCTWQAANNKPDIYADVVKTLIQKWWNVIVSNYLAHESWIWWVKWYLEQSKLFSFKEMKNIYRQPKRKLVSRCWYYHDWCTKTLAVKSESSTTRHPYVYDVTLKWKLYMVKVK